MNETMWFADNELHISDKTKLPAKITALFGGSASMMIEVMFPKGKKAYLLPEDDWKLKNDTAAYAKENESDWMIK